MLNLWSVAMPLECGALQEIGPHGVDHREYNEGQWHNLSTLSLFDSKGVIQQEHVYRPVEQTVKTDVALEDEDSVLFV